MAQGVAAGGRVLGWVLLYAAAGLAGRATVPDGGTLALVWPAAGVGALWLATATRRTLPVDLAGLTVGIYLVNRTTGATAYLAAVFVVVGLLQAAVLVAVLRHRRPHLHLFGGTQPVATLVDLVEVVAALAVSAAVGAAVGGAGMALRDVMSVDLVDVAVWWGRNTAGAVMVVLPGLLLLQRIAAVGPVGPRRSPAEVVGWWTLSAAVLVLVFGVPDVPPLSYLLLVATVGISVRLSPLAVASHALVLCAGALGFTLAGRGPFAAVPDLALQAVVCQGFVLLTVLTGMVLNLSRAERDEGARRLLELQRATAERARMFGRVLDNLQEGLNVVAADGRVLMTNPAGDRLLGRRVGGVVDPGSVDADYGLVAVDGSPLAPDEVPFVRATRGETFTQDYLVARPGGPEPFLLEITAGPLQPDHGPPHAVMSFRDVTAQRRDRDALASFAGVVAHDLKRPLTVVSGWTEALIEDLDAGELDRESGLAMLHRVAGSAQQMGRLLDDLLDFTVVRDAEVHLEPVDVSAVAEQVARVLRDGEASPRISVAPGLRVVADPVLVRQVLDNLLANAVTYVAPGVRPRVSVSGRDEGSWLVLHVADNGIGVPEAQRERVFDTFFRAHADDYRGTGLGLAIVRRAVERCGGTVRVTGAPGGGSCFELRLPAARCDRAVPAKTG